MIKKHYKLIIAGMIVLMVITVFTICSFSSKKKDLSFEKVGEFPYTCNSEINDSELVWFTLRDEKFNGFFSDDILDNYKVEYSEFDYSKYTYVICVGHELKSISYSNSETKNRKLLIFPKQFVGIVSLSEEKSCNLYIYRIPKMDIDCDYHNRSRLVSFEKD